MAEMTKKQLYIKSMFPDNSELEEWVDDVVKKIHELGEIFGTHKYDIWIAKEVKKDESIILQTIDLQLVIDWAVNSSFDILSLSFEEALLKQEEWHNQIVSQEEDRMVKIPEVDQDRVIFVTSDEKYFLYVLETGDLHYEGTMMRHCVKEDGYKAKVRDKRSVILSLRDMNNKPHVTLEIAISKNKRGEYSGRVVQQYGKANQLPQENYRKALKECVLFMCDCIDDETERFLDMNYF